jgi:hypothetical protein
VFKRIRHEWRSFVDCDPGSRFERLHERKKRGTGIARRLFWWTAGVLLILAGIVMLVTPGPGLLSIAFGVGCLAKESLALARRCDRAELRLRAGLRRARARRRGRD